MPRTATARRATSSRTSTPASKRSSSSPTPCPANPPVSGTVDSLAQGESGSAGGLILDTGSIQDGGTGSFIFNNNGINAQPGVYTTIQTQPFIITSNDSDWITVDTETQVDPDGWYQTLEDETNDTWMRTQAQAVKQALLIAARHRDRHANQWITASTTTGSCNHINITNTISASTATDWEINPAVWRYIAEYTGKVKPKKSIEPARMNHHGVLIRSSDRGNMFNDISQQEMLALQLLRKMVEPDAFRKYLRHGFVPIRAASGLIYQIDRRNRIKVWEMGELLAELCVHLKGHCPPTDEVVGKILIVEYNEADIWKRSNITWHTDNRNRRSLELIGQASADGRPANQINIVNGGAGLIYATG